MGASVKTLEKGALNSLNGTKDKMNVTFFCCCCFWRNSTSKGGAADHCACSAQRKARKRTRTLKHCWQSRICGGWDTPKLCKTSYNFITKIIFRYFLVFVLFCWSSNLQMHKACAIECYFYLKTQEKNLKGKSIATLNKLHVDLHAVPSSHFPVALYINCRYICITSLMHPKPRIHVNLILCLETSVRG